MQAPTSRREILRLAAAGSLACLARPTIPALWAQTPPHGLVSPGARRSRVKVAKIYLGVPGSHYPNPDLDLKKEVQFYEAEFAKLKDELTDVEFVVQEMVSSVDQLNKWKNNLKDVDGILAIHLSLWTMPVLEEILRLGRPTMIFSAPYSGHEWHPLSALYKQEKGRNFECILTSDYRQLAEAIRPFRALHHLREAKILNLTTQAVGKYEQQIREKFGTEIKQVALRRVLDLYEAVSSSDAEAETNAWIKGATEVVEPSRAEILKSCRLALAFERLLDEEEATVMTADCYGSMWEPLCRAYAYPCIAFSRLNNLGLGGICQSDLPCAMTHILFQGLSGRPGFVCNPGFDYSKNSAVMIHCLGTPKMDGPRGPAAPYKLRSVMERREGAVPQVKMRTEEKVTIAVLPNTSKIPYFTGQITDTPETDRGCRTKITVRVDGDAEQLWKNWSDGIHRVACYGDLTKPLEHFCRFTQIDMINEALRPSQGPARG
ncbi:MAG: hypothetical protein M1376_13975 [Planctomycetes bacterium]|nr:hypothetical protein [Planctomycetota bacterium]